MKNSQCARRFAGFAVFWSFQRQRVVAMAPLSSSLTLFLCCCIALCVGMNEELHSGDGEGLMSGSAGSGSASGSGRAADMEEEEEEEDMVETGGYSEVAECVDDMSAERDERVDLTSSTAYTAAMCSLLCIESVTSNPLHQEIELQNTTISGVGVFKSFPPFNSENHKRNCPAFREFAECVRGCLVRVEPTAANSNQRECRHECVSECREEKDSDGFYVNPYCRIDCNGKICKQGCGYYETIVRSSNTQESPPRPVLGPEVVSSSRDAQALVSISHSLAPANEQGHPPALTAIVYRVVDRSTNVTMFFYKASPEEPLSLEDFACRSVSVSFVLVNKFGASLKSPPLIFTDPEMRLDCRRLWDERGFINISVSWTLSTPTSLPAIRRFSVLPLLMDSSLPGRRHEYSRQRITTEAEKMNYSVLLTNLLPQRMQSYKYKIEVRVQRGNQYLWRRVPSTESCTVSTESEPPTSVTGVSVGRVETEREGEGLIFELSWSPPVTTNGELTEYEVNVVTDATGEGLLLHHSTYPASQLSTAVNITLPSNTSFHCLYALVRSRNGYVWSDWSEPGVVPIVQECLSTTNTTLKDDSVTVFYQRAGEEAVRITELSCSSGDFNSTTYESVSDKLLTLEQKLDSVSDMTRALTVAEGLLERLRNIENKIDQILNAVSQTSSSDE